MLPRITFIFLVSVSAGAAPAFEAITEATNLEHFLKAEQSLQQKFQLKKDCEKEMELQYFPKHCFLWLEGQLKEVEVPKSWQQYQVMANKLCVEKVTGLTGFEEIASVIELLSVGNECKETLEIRKADLEYVNSQKTGLNIEISPGNETLKSKTRLL